MLSSFVSRSRRVAETAGSESKLEGELNQLLKDLLASQQIAYDPFVNETLTASGAISHASPSRPDSLFGHVVLEYKKPGTLSKPAQIKNAQEQVQIEYLDALSGGHKESAADCEKWAGIIWDGFKISFCYSDGIEWKWSQAHDVSEATLLSLIQTYRGLDREPLTATRLSKNFGKESRLASDTIRQMCNLLMHPQQRTNMLFSEWKRLFEQVSTYNLSQLPSLQRWARRNQIASEDASVILFGLHTYYSIVVKLLTSDLLAASRPLSESLVDEIAGSESELKLINCFRKLEDSQFYRGYRINNLLEGDFFSWYIGESSAELSHNLLEIAMRMRRFEPATAKLRPHVVKDLLKEFYSSLVDEDIRHDLGEYYTPDWLVDYVLDQLGYTGDPTRVAVDPACGSGTYLVQCIGRVRKYCDEHGYSTSGTLKAILNCVRGLDLNPLAVISARANYVLSISDLIFDLGHDIEIPVYLADAINVPTEDASGDVWEFPLDTLVEEIKLQIPKVLVKQQVLGKILLQCEEYIKFNKTADEFVGHLSQNPEFGHLIDDLVSEKLSDFYNKIRSLNLRNPPWDSIWCRVVKNNFSPKGFGNVDYIVGNVPWVRWSRLPNTYRSRVKSFCEHYGLVSGSGFTGGIESDISTVLAFSAADNWLGIGGKIGILITWTVFKSASAKGFRIGKLPNGSGLRMDLIEDLTAIQPFPDAINETGIYFATKVANAQEAEFSEKNCRIWKSLKSSRIDPSLALADVMQNMQIEEGKALPVAGFGSPLWTGSRSSYDSVSFLKGSSSYLDQTHRGTVNDIARVYWVKVEKYSRETNRALIRTLTQDELRGARPVDPVNGFWIEADVLFPLLRGRDVGRFSTKASDWYQIVPNQHYRQYENETEFANKHPLTYAYFMRYENLLKKRSTYKRYSSTLPFYGIFCVGDYSFSTHKVVWMELQDPGNFRASVVTNVGSDAVIPNQIVVPDHKLYLVNTETIEEAHYVCAVLNSRPVRTWLGGFLLGKQIATAVFSYMNIPQYDPQNPKHQELSQISIDAHTARSGQKNDNLLEEVMESELEALVHQIIV